MRTTGIIKWYNDTKGYGFINEKGEGKQDIFVHYSAIKDHHLVKEGDHVIFEYQTGPKGPQAFKVEVQS